MAVIFKIRMSLYTMFWILFLLDMLYNFVHFDSCRNSARNVSGNYTWSVGVL